MNTRLLAAALCGALLAQGACANETLARQRLCLNCHGVQERKVRSAPSFREVALKYSGSPAAEAALVKKVLNGGNGSFGVVPMPAQRGLVGEDEVRVLVRWVLGTT